MLKIACFEIERIRFPDEQLDVTLSEAGERFAALSAEREKSWRERKGAPVKAWAAFTQRNHRDFSYPANFAEVLGDTLEIKLFMAAQHLRILEAGLVPTLDDSVQIGISWLRGHGFIIEGGFLDSFSRSVSVRRDYRELKVPNNAEISSAMVRPEEAAKAWKTKRAAGESRKPRLTPSEGGWRETVPAKRLSPDENVEKLQKRITDELIYMQRRDDQEMSPDTGAAAKLGELLQEQAEAARYRSPDAARLKEIWEDLDLFEKRQAAMKELGLVMPPDPTGLLEALHKCTETLQITRQMRSQFKRLGRLDEPIPLSFHWRLPEVRGQGVLFIIRFNEPDGPIGTRLLRMDAFPIRAHIAPEKALAEWKALCEREYIRVT